MEKVLIIVNGTMGVGKSTVCKELNNRLNRSVWLDGDWCWMMNPFVVNQENKDMVVDNITYLLRNFLHNSSVEYIILSWVIHYADIFDLLLNHLNDLHFQLLKITLTCSAAALEERILGDIEQNLRDEDAVNLSIDRLPLYKDLNTYKIDTTELSVYETADKIIQNIENSTRNLCAGFDKFFC